MDRRAGQRRARSRPTRGRPAGARSRQPGAQASGPRALRYLACLRPVDILVLQGSPLLGAALAIGTPTFRDLAPLLTLLVANVLLVTHIFLLNDWAGLASDFHDPNKASRVFTARGVPRRDIGLLTAGFLLASLLVFSHLGPVVLGLAVAIAVASALYSLPRCNWKAKPVLSSLLHLVGGTLHFLLGYCTAHAIDRRGVALAAFFALVFAAGHLTQEVRDHEGDRRTGIRTNAVVFGPRRVFAASLLLFALAQGQLALLCLEGVLPRPFVALVAFFPLQLLWSLQALREGLGYASVSRVQMRYRLLYAAIGAAMVAGLWLAPMAGRT